MTFRRFLASTALFCIANTAAFADLACAPMGSSATELPLDDLDRADPVTARVSEPIETALLAGQIDKSTPAPLQKLYCDIGMFGLKIRFVQPVEDDAIRATVTEAQYAWDSTQDPAGWILTSLRRQFQCARGDMPFAAVCP
jgi:hypothetical protein